MITNLQNITLDERGTHGNQIKSPSIQQLPNVPWNLNCNAALYISLVITLDLVVRISNSYHIPFEHSEKKN